MSNKAIIIAADVAGVVAMIVSTIFGEKDRQEQIAAAIEEAKKDKA